MCFNFASSLRNGVHPSPTDGPALVEVGGLFQARPNQASSPHRQNFEAAENQRTPVSALSVDQFLHREGLPLLVTTGSPPNCHIEMAPQKRKPEDDFIYTLSDNEDGPAVPEEELQAAEPPKKKAKTSKKAKPTKKDKKNAKQVDEDEDEEGEAPEGVWGRNDEDDGAMDSDFEFVAEDAGSARTRSSRAGASRVPGRASRRSGKASILTTSFGAEERRRTARAPGKTPRKWPAMPTPAMPRTPRSRTIWKST